MVFAMPGDPIVALFGDKTADPRRCSSSSASSTTSTSRSSCSTSIYLGGIFQGDFGTSVLGPARLRDPRPDLPGHAAPRAARHLLRDGRRHHRRPHLGSAQGQHLRRDARLVVSLVLISLPIFVVALRRAVRLRHPARLVQDRPWAPGAPDARPDPAGARAGDASASRRSCDSTRASVIDTRSQDFVRTATSKGLSPTPHRPRARPAQLAHPGRHLPRRRLRRR